MSAEAAAQPLSSRISAGLRPLLLLAGVAAAVAAGMLVVLWSRGPTYSLLFTDLNAEDQAAVAQALDAAGIPYRIGPDSNSLSVPAERLNDARLKLAGQGLPAAGGFAALTKEPGFGLSQFMENARYQHALEAELAHTIASLKPVAAARVHLAAPRQSAFVRDRKPVSASVFVQLRAGQRLDAQQVRSIVNLVASSIPELDASQVTVVDQHGHLLSAPQSDSELALREKHFELVRRLEQDYVRRIEDLLTPLVGPGRVRAQVVAQVDHSTTEEAREQYNPGSQVVRTEQTSSQTSSDGLTAGGVPGSLSNQPPPAGAVQPPGAAAAIAPAAASSSSQQSSRQYEIDRTLAYTRQPSGRLQRLTVAVLIDHLRVTNENGQVQEKPLSAGELERISTLVKDAVGFDASRGDSVTVVNSPFLEMQTEPPAELEKPALWESPLVHDALKVLAALLAIAALIFLVLRPLARGLLEHSRQVTLSRTEAAAPATTVQVMPAGAGALAYEDRVAHARALVGQDPRRVAQVVKSWVSEDE